MVNVIEERGSDGRLVYTKDTNGWESHYIYDSGGDYLKFSTKDGELIVWKYTKVGELVHYIESNGNKWYKPSHSIKYFVMHYTHKILKLLSRLKLCN